ncbi:MAG: hypothetical protein AAF291_14820 [Pseudomonadota bacterium]
MKLSKLAVLASTAAVTFGAPFAASAQDAGATVFSQVDESTVGTIESNDGTTAILDTGDYKAPLPVGTYAMRDGKWTINATKAQIDGMMAAAEAEAEKKLAAALVDGATVISADTMPVGTVLAMDPEKDQYLVESDTSVITLKREHFAVNPSGELTALFTSAQLDGFAVEVPEGAVVETPEGKMTRTADGWQAMESTSAEAASGMSASK